MKVIACLAASVDGKITSAKEEGWVRLGSDADLERLFTLRAQADAVVFGASTFRAWPGIRRAKQQDKSVPPLHYCLSNSWDLPGLEKVLVSWQSDWPPFYVVSAKAPPAELDRYRSLAWLEASTNVPTQILNHAEQSGVNTLLLEGGGTLIEQFLQAQAIDELHLTLTPWLIGGVQTPSLVSGEGFSSKNFPKLELLDCQPKENELFLTYAVRY